MVLSSSHANYRKILITSSKTFTIINVFHISPLRKEAHDACTSKLLCKYPPICANWFDRDHIVLIIPTPASIVDVGKILSTKLIVNEGQNGADAAGPMATRTPTLHEIDQHSIGLMLIWSFIVLTLVVTAFPLIAVFS